MPSAAKVRAADTPTTEMRPAEMCTADMPSAMPAAAKVVTATMTAATRVMTAAMTAATRVMTAAMATTVAAAMTTTMTAAALRNGVACGR